MTLLQEYRTAADFIIREKEIFQTYEVKQVESIPKIFYCEWLPENNSTEKLTKEKIKAKYPHCCFNHRVGLPTLKFDDGKQSEPMPLNRYQQRILAIYNSTKKYGQNKTRGSGTSELKTVRWNLFKYIHTRNRGRKALISAGISEDLSTVFMRRIKELCDRIPEVYLFEPKSDQPTEIFLRQGGILKAVPASANAIRSYENVGDVDLEESGFWKLNDDKPVLKGALPHVTKSGAHVNSISTPNGKRGFMWEMIFDPDVNSQFVKHTVNWREVVGLPVMEPIELHEFEWRDKTHIKKYFEKRWNHDKEWKNWFVKFFNGRPLDEILSVTAPILDVNEIISLYTKDRATYDQELDNQFIVSENRAFGDFPEEDFEPEEFE